jgi:hypothetical protein
VAGAVALPLVLVAAVVSKRSSLTPSVTTSVIRSDLGDHPRAVRPGVVGGKEKELVPAALRRTGGITA